MEMVIGYQLLVISPEAEISQLPISLQDRFLF